MTFAEESNDQPVTEPQRRPAPIGNPAGVVKHCENDPTLLRTSGGGPTRGRVIWGGVVDLPPMRVLAKALLFTLRCFGKVVWRQKQARPLHT